MKRWLVLPSLSKISAPFVPGITISIVTTELHQFQMTMKRRGIKEETPLVVPWCQGSFSLQVP